jgi:hypothetical protein
MRAAKLAVGRGFTGAKNALPVLLLTQLIALLARNGQVFEFVINSLS